MNVRQLPGSVLDAAADGDDELGRPLWVEVADGDCPDCVSHERVTFLAQDGGYNRWRCACGREWSTPIAVERGRR